MASSSVSQESLDMEDYGYCARRTKIRTLRARGALPGRSGDREGGDSCEREGRDQNGERTENGPSGVIQDHDSPTRSAASRAKNTRNRPNHLHKGKLPKDKRKLREKRRSTGVVHLASTESTGDSLDDDDEEKGSSETKRNTTYNEVIDADNPQTRLIDLHLHNESKVNTDRPVIGPGSLIRPLHLHNEDWDRVPKGFSTRRNKSPSDLEADLEDNQDYDSTVSQSETNLTLIGQPDSSTEPASVKFGYERNCVLSKFSPTEHASKPFKPFSSNRSDNDSRTPTSSTSSSSSVLSRYRETESPKRDIPETTKTVTGFTSRYIDKKNENDSSFTSRYRYRDKFNHMATPNSYQSTQSVRDEEKERLEKLLEKEREENKRLLALLEEKDKKIADLEREVTLMNKEMDELDEENEKLQADNSALIRALSQLSTRV
ncbi:hypothetical protein ScPMuIL_012675 [Solemya velum]